MRPIAGRSSIIACLALALPGVVWSEDGLDPMAGTLSRDEPQAVYSPDPADPWNRVFHALFSRTIRARVTGDFRGAAPLETTKATGRELEVSKKFFERIEGGDRAIEPLDPFASSFGSKLALEVLEGKGFDRLKGALADALDDPSPRSILARALMQADIWAAYDVIYASGHEAAEARDRREELLGLVARLVGKLALTPREIESLPRNFEDARLPFRLSEEGGPWLEVEFLPDPRTSIFPTSARHEGLPQAHQGSGRPETVARRPPGIRRGFFEARRHGARHPAPAGRRIREGRPLDAHLRGPGPHLPERLGAGRGRRPASSWPS